MNDVVGGHCHQRFFFTSVFLRLTMVSVSTSVFKSPVTDCAFWSPAMMLLTAIFINIPSLLISTRIWCFRQIVYDIAGTGLEAAVMF